MKRFTTQGFLARILFALILVLVTINPSGYSYFHWTREALGASQFGAWQAFLGLLLIVAWVIYVRATARSLGIFGVLLAVAVFAAVIWLLIDTGLIKLEGSDALAWVILVATGLILGVGMSWSHIRRRLSGQLDVDDIEE